MAADDITPNPTTGVIDLSCASTGSTGQGSPSQCYVSPFMYVDLNAAVKVNDPFRFFVNVQNIGNARAPLAAGAYTSNPNYLASWHYAGLVGRNYSAGVSLRF